MTFYDEIAKLKNILRKGWIIRNIGDHARVESDAEHTFSIIMLALEVMQKKDLKLDQLKVIKMIAYHELCEIDAGDTTPFDHVSKEEKYKKELACVERLTKEYNMPEIKTLWLEFEENKTLEAQFVKKIDKYDAVMQSKVYSQMLKNDELYNEFHGNCKFSQEFDELEL